ncbi:hypothetical protein HYH03_003661 [Edaphochlamys debaryana]|uniref:Fungal lipase-type domain-containing protein n=1 Tax=Edaphochlamys debaryana TaxID=47281 RepID=A0A836C445_9CHLO|nr:hypothetical protein HYH03_003661 [Edaphochlamys debaryana]|eukprot:KAG2498402.1 hypothetical protein HYH03_003661 [Edaphochlamys debaryana]
MHVAFRGTENIRDALSNIDVRRVDAKFQGRQVRLHSGFYRQYASIQSELRALIRQQTASREVDTIYLTGHSLGGALATIAAADVATMFPETPVHCYTFGAPRTGDAAFVHLFDQHVSSNLRVVNEDDPVPMVPISPRFQHVSNGIVIDDKGVITAAKTDLPWFVRPLLGLAYLDPSAPIRDHDCGVYIGRLGALRSPHTRH